MTSGILANGVLKQFFGPPIHRKPKTFANVTHRLPFAHNLNLSISLCYSDFTLQTNAFIASDEIVFATTLQIRITLQTNMFIASDERVLCYGRTLLALEMNAIELEMNFLPLKTNAGDERWRRTLETNAGDVRVENALERQRHTHTASFQRLPRTIYADMIASHSYTHLRKRVPSVTLRRSKRYQRVPLH